MVDISRVSASLPEFPWDVLAPHAARARSHPGGLIDLSMGTPVDPVPKVIQDALVAAAAEPGYPTTAGTPALRGAIVDWLARRCSVHGLSSDPGVHVLPTVGAKELVASLPSALGVASGDTVVLPELAYPTYEVGARLAGAAVVRANSTVQLGPLRPRLLWVNSPANPTGQILPPDHLRKLVAWARERGVIVVSDECYLELGWGAEPISILHPSVCDGSFEGLLAVHSLSKRSQLAGYRAGFVAGDSALINELWTVRKHAGLIVPAPVQAAMAAALSDDEHVAVQRRRYAARRDVLRSAFTAAGFEISHSEAGLYLWATRGEDCWQTVRWCAERGVLVSPGTFYGPAGGEYIRIAFTATDERVGTVAQRLSY